MRKLILLILLITAALFLCGCPKPAQYARPQMPAPETWPENSAIQPDAQDSVSPSEMNWKTFFADGRLQEVIQIAIENNRDLRMAAFNIEKSQALFRIQRAEQYPEAGLSIQGEGYRMPENLSGGSKAKTISQFTVGLGATSWELDLFGRIKSLKSAALERYFASEQARLATQISLVSSVAGSYLELAADRQTLKLAEETMKTQQAYFDLIRQTRDLGIASDLEVSQAKTQVEAARVDIARYSGYIAQDQNALNLLAGAPVPARLLPNTLEELPKFKDMESGVPSDVLLKRPDILMSEHQLKAYHANIGAARAAFFPRISLTGLLGIASSDLTNLFKPAAGTWNFVPQLALPIFDYGSRQANYEATRLDRDIAVAQYEKNIQSAFREVSDALSLRSTLMEQQSAQEALVKSLEETYKLSEARYKGGIDSYLSVLVAQRSLYGARQQLVGMHRARLNNLVILYKVLGGGA